MKSLPLSAYISFALLGAIALVAQTPATVVAAIVAQQSGGKLRLHASEGTLWRGQGQLALGDSGIWQAFGWEWQARDLLRGKLGFALRADGGRGKVQIGWSSIDFSDIDLSTHAAPFAKLDPRSASYGLSGLLRLTTTKFHLGKQAEGGLTLEWQRAASQKVPVPAELGNYRATFAPQGNAWKVQLATLNGALQLNGNGTWHSKDGLAADIIARAAPGNELALAPLLNQIGPGTPEQERRMKFNFR